MSEIIDLLKTVEGVNGVYFLTNKGKIVYVGQSGDISKRIKQHIKEGIKIFDSFSFLKCGIRETSWQEARFINMYKPIYNKVIPSCWEDMDWWNVWWIDDEMSEFRIEVLREWMDRNRFSTYKSYKRGDLDGFKDFCKWWKITNKRMSTYHCLPGDVVKWIDLGCPKG